MTLKQESDADFFEVEGGGTQLAAPSLPSSVWMWLETVKL